MIAPSNNGRTAYDIEITKVKSVEVERRVPIDVSGAKNNNILERVAKVGQPLISHTKETPMEMPDLEDVSGPRSAFSTPSSTRRQSGGQELGVRTTPIPIIRGDSPASLRSGLSSGAPVRTAPVAGYGAEFNMLMSETRIQNTEMRMNVQRISDKVDTLIHGPHAPAVSATSPDGITGKLDAILEQNMEIKTLLGRQQASSESGSLIEDNLIKQQHLNEEFEKIKLLKLTLKEKEQHLEQEMQRNQSRVQELQEKFDEQVVIAERSQEAARAEVRKLLGSTARLLVAQFSEDEEYTGGSVRETIAGTLGLIADKLQEKYGGQEARRSGDQETRRSGDQEKYGDPGARRGPPVAAVAPVPAEVEEWAESDE